MKSAQLSCVYTLLTILTHLRLCVRVCERVCVCVSTMSLKKRKFSLDSSVSQDAAGRFNSRRGSNQKLIKKYTNVEDSGLNIQELNENLNDNVTVREKTSAEECIDRRDGLVSNNSFHKHNKHFHKLFQEIPEGENPIHTFICALQKEVLYHGKLFISENYVCFFSSVLLKETKVLIPISSIQEVKKHGSAFSMLSIQTADEEKYFLISVKNREMCYNLLQPVYSHVQSSVPRTGGSAKSSPHGSSAENEADYLMVSSHSSFDDSVDHGMKGKNGNYLEDNNPHSASKGATQSVSSTDEVDQASSLLWRIMEDVTQFFFRRQRVNFGTVFYIYLMLLVFLLVVSAYIGLRMIALEEQLNSLTELSLEYRDHQET
ncbi:GRAM domain-containing protein 2A-like isoform X2 [Phycodurus eques]|uniref:GRAM domain-containing protein 2A-like isoform X2 n=1 Tax=Phycodurus eques TaxID=693459 RepID=UPI002ACE49A3|nr:GRAM domain-containing protein 2A-like isoform X2 [Phycodurus eques]